MDDPLLRSHSRDKRVTSSDAIGMQFFWQGYQAFTHSLSTGKGAPCFFEDQCACALSTNAGADAEAMRIMPLTELRERSILDGMQVQIVSIGTGRFLRASRLTKFLRWSEARDEQTVFRIHILEPNKPLAWNARYTLMSEYWPGWYVGFSQSSPFGCGSEASAHSMGFLTLEKKKQQSPLHFPVRFRAVRSSSQARHSSSGMASPTSASYVIPLAETEHFEFLDEQLARDHTDVPLALALSEDGEADDDEMEMENHEPEPCPYCSGVFRHRESLLAHIRDYHGDWVNRESVPGRYCTQCGQRKNAQECSRCDVSRSAQATHER